MEGTDDVVREGLLEDIVDDGGPIAAMFGGFGNRGISGDGDDERTGAGERDEMEGLRVGKEKF